MVLEFYANWATKSRSHFSKVRGVDVTLTLAIINDILGMNETDPLVLTGLENFSTLPCYSTHTLWVLVYVLVDQE